MRIMTDKMPSNPMECIFSIQSGGKYFCSFDEADVDKPCDPSKCEKLLAVYGYQVTRKVKEWEV